MRVAAHSGSLYDIVRFFKLYMTLIDLIALLPYYIELIFFHSSILEFQRLSVIRLFRIFRLFRYFRYSNYLQLSMDVMVIAVKASKEALFSLFFFFIFFLILFSTLLYFTERGTFDEERKLWLDAQGHPRHGVTWFFCCT
jgi:hypothetical protein